MRFGWFGKGNSITDDVVLKRMPPVREDFDGLLFEDDCPQNLYKGATIQDTIRGGSTTSHLVPCHDTVETLVDKIKDGWEVYYVTSRPFMFTCTGEDGVSTEYEATIDVSSSKLLAWLQAHTTDIAPGLNMTADKFAAFFDERSLPDWLSIGEKRTPKPPPPDILKPGVKVFGRYLIQRQLGEGGMGKVFLATDEQTTIDSRRQVVLKVLQNAQDPAQQKLLIKEANLLADLKHDCIATCFGCRLNGALPILVMEYVEGVSLDKYLAQQPGGKVDETALKELLRPIADALDDAHRGAVYHLDVKPQNIIVRTTPKKGKRTCLLDFGIARRTPAEGPMTCTTQVSGTRPYMSPDQLLNEPPSAAMDVYSLAVTAYECLTGRLPYPEGFKLSVRPALIASDTPLARAIMKGLDANPKARPATCLELVDPPRESGGGEDKPVKVDPKQPPPLSSLEKSFANYRRMLLETAKRTRDAARVEWLIGADGHGGCQSTLRDLTKDLSRADEHALVAFFNGVKARLTAEKMSPDDFFVATDRLLELRCGLPKTGGAVWQALKDSIS